jgi:rRNA processing protein Gar1
MGKKKKKKNPYLTIRREWTRNPTTKIKTSDKIYIRKKKVKEDECT